MQPTCIQITNRTRLTQSWLCFIMTKYCSCGAWTWLTQQTVVSGPMNTATSCPDVSQTNLQWSKWHNIQCTLLLTINFSYSYIMCVVAWCSGQCSHLNERSYSMPGLVSTWTGNRWQMGKSSSYITHHPSQLSLAIPLWDGEWVSALSFWGAEKDCTFMVYFPTILFFFYMQFKCKAQNLKHKNHSA